MPTTLPWYKSKIILGAAISIIAKVLVMGGVMHELAPADSDNLADLIVLVVGGVGDVIAIGARLTQKVAPAITATNQQ